ncbi:MAG: lycopene cyclase family protein, partial [Planctomycetota bacterium]
MREHAVAAEDEDGRFGSEHLSSIIGGLAHELKQRRRAVIARVQSVASFAQPKNDDRPETSGAEEPRENAGCVDLHRTLTSQVKGVVMRRSRGSSGRSATGVVVMRSTKREASEVLILGGGCAGLSLAWRLLDERLVSDQGVGSVVIVEPRPAYRRDRTWCFWADESSDDVPTAVMDAVERRWQRWEVVDTDGRSVEREHDGLSYHGLPADRLYDLMLERLHADPRVRWIAGKADGTADRAGTDIINADGDRETIVARHVVDTRPPATYDANGFARTPADPEGVVQQFAGAEFERVDGEPLDAGRATLMDFAAAEQRSAGVEFLYVLPEASGRALVEWTGMLGEPTSAESAWARLEDAAAKRLPG